MANTLDVNLVTDTISETVLKVVPDKLAPLSAFSTEISLDPLKPGVDVQVGIVTDGSPVRKNVTDWAQGSTTTESRPVTVNQLSATYPITPAELNQGHKLSQWASIHALKLANQVMDDVVEVMSLANFTTNDAIEVDRTAFGHDELKGIWGSTNKYMDKNLILDSNLYSNFLPSTRDNFDPSLSHSGLYGFDQFHHNGRFTAGSAEDLAGFFGDKSAIIVAAGLPHDDQTPDSEFLIKEVIPVSEQLGLSVLFTVWYDRNSRTTYGSFDVMLGAGVGVESQGTLLIDAV